MNSQKSPQKLFGMKSSVNFLLLSCRRHNRQQKQQHRHDLILSGKNVSALYISSRHHRVVFGTAKNFTPCYSLWNRPAKFSLLAPKWMAKGKKMALGRTSVAGVSSFSRNLLEVQLSFIVMRPTGECEPNCRVLVSQQNQRQIHKIKS